QPFGIVYCHPLLSSKFTCHLMTKDASTGRFTDASTNRLLSSITVIQVYMSSYDQGRFNWTLHGRFNDRLLSSITVIQVYWYGQGRFNWTLHGCFNDRLLSSITVIQVYMSS